MIYTLFIVKAICLPPPHHTYTLTIPARSKEAMTPTQIGALDRSVNKLWVYFFAYSTSMSAQVAQKSR